MRTKEREKAKGSTKWHNHEMNRTNTAWVLESVFRPQTRPNHLIHRRSHAPVMLRHPG